MGEARKVIIVFLFLLFIIIGLGVLFSRLSKNKNGKPVLGGVLDNVFFSKSLRVTPTPSPVKENLITIRTDSQTNPQGTTGGNSNTTVTNNYSNPNQIPATGTPTVVLVLSSMGASAGILLKRYSR